VLWDKRIHALPAFGSSEPIAIGGATVLPQSLWVLGGAALAVLALRWFFDRTLFGKAMQATAHNPLAARLVGIHTRSVMWVSFGLAAALGALGGVLTAPITFTSYDIGVMLGLKGFAAAMLGGLGSFGGAVAGGLLLGLMESLGAGFVSSAYKDAIAFVVILAVLFFMPGGLFGAREAIVSEARRRHRAAPCRPGRGMPRWPAWPWALLLLPLALPNAYFFDVAILVALNAMVCVGLNLLVGYAGQISLGHAGSTRWAPTAAPSCRPSTAGRPGCRCRRPHSRSACWPCSSGARRCA
jgi:ABC-type branched-subunit amino acid transport system permease subunit